MKTLRFVTYLALGFVVAGCAVNPASTPSSKLPPPVAKAPSDKTPETDVSGLPERVAAVPEEVAPVPAPQPDTIDLGSYDPEPIKETVETVAVQPYETVSLDPVAIEAAPVDAFYNPQYVDVSQVRDIPNAGQPLARGRPAPAPIISRP